MDAREEKAAMRYLDQVAADQDRRLEEIREEIQRLQGGTLEEVLRRCEKRLEEMVESGAAERLASVRKISLLEALDEIEREAYRPLREFRRREQEASQRRAQRMLLTELGEDPAKLEDEASSSGAPTIIETEEQEREHLRRIAEAG